MRCEAISRDFFVSVRYNSLLADRPSLLGALVSILRAGAARALYMTELNLWFNEMFISAENFHFYGTRLNNATAYTDRLHTIRGPGKYSDLSFVLKGLLKRSIKIILLAPALTNRKYRNSRHTISQILFWKYGFVLNRQFKYKYFIIC